MWIDKNHQTMQMYIRHVVEQSTVVHSTTCACGEQFCLMNQARNQDFFSGAKCIKHVMWGHCFIFKQLFILSIQAVIKQAFPTTLLHKESTAIYKFCFFILQLILTYWCDNTVHNKAVKALKLILHQQTLHITDVLIVFCLLLANNRMKLHAWTQLQPTAYLS